MRFGQQLAGDFLRSDEGAFEIEQLHETDS